jgi:hypothetical protein
MQNGKGDKPRITDYKKYRKNYPKSKKDKNYEGFKELKNGVFRKIYI